MNSRCRTHCEDLIRQAADSFPEIDSPGMRLITRIFRLRDLVYENAQREMARFDLSTTEFSVLSTLRKSPAPHALRPADICKGMLLTSGGLTKVLKALEGRGLVDRAEDPSDGRGCLIRLTPEGLAFAERAMQTVIGSDVDLLLRATDADTVAAAAEALRPFTEALDR